jgi:hypothetical protein
MDAFGVTDFVHTAKVGMVESGCCSCLTTEPLELVETLIACKREYLQRDAAIVLSVESQKNGPCFAPSESLKDPVVAEC